MYQLLCSDLLTTFGYGQILPLLNLYLLGRGFSLSAIALSASLLLATCFLCSLPAGLFADLSGSKPALILGGVLQSLAVWGEIAAQNPQSLYLASLLAGMALALFSSAKVPLLSQLVPGDRLASTITLCRAVASLGGVLGGATAAWLCSRQGNSGLPLTLGAISTSLAILPLLWLPTRLQGYSWRLLVRPRWQGQNIRRLLAAFCLLAIGYSLLTPYANLLLAGRGLTEGAVSASFAAWQLVAIIAWPVTLGLSRILRQPLPVAILALATATVLLTCPLPFAGWWALWLLWQMALVLVQSFLMAAIGRSSRRALNFSGLSMLQTGGAMLGTLAGGALLQAAPEWLYLAAAGCCLTAWVALPRS